MCGIAGFIGNGTRESLERMLAAVAHRGPDDQGIVVEQGIGFAHARLSILDTSPAGHQPMFLPDRSVAITFNGELYNFKILREELERQGGAFRSSSDTEVVLRLYERDGDDFLKNVSGMFALALYDFKKEKLILARDRAGEKPLYYTQTLGALFFASELGALMASGVVPRQLDLAAVEQYLFFDYVPTPDCLIQGVHKLEPATILIYEHGTITKKKFWRPPQSTLALSETEAPTELDRLLKESVARQMVADVPLGVFLSGGIDSSAVAAYAVEVSPSPVDTFSIGFAEASFDESRYAREVAAHLGTRHHEHQMTTRDALDLIPTLGSVLSEPVADASIIPTLFLSRFARKSVTVALGGDGADELFAGYPTFHAERAYSFYQHLPTALQGGLTRMVGSTPASTANFPLSYNLRKFASAKEQSSFRRHQEWLGSFGSEARTRLAGPPLKETSSDLFTTIDALAEEMPNAEIGNRLLYTYFRTYLMDEVLAKVDRASMHYALETRAPFLDPAMLDFALALPYHFKYRIGTTKYLLKKILQNKLPAHIVNRKKKGFGIPLAAWLKGPLRPLAEELLAPKALRVHGLFDEKEVTRLMREHQSGARDNRKELWNLMTFQLWYAAWIA